MRAHALRSDLLRRLDLEPERIAIERERRGEILNGDADVIERRPSCHAVRSTSVQPTFRSRAAAALDLEISSAAVYGSISRAAIAIQQSLELARRSTSRSTCCMKRCDSSSRSRYSRACAAPLAACVRCGCARNRSIASTSSGTPFPVVASVFTIGGRHSSGARTSRSDRFASTDDTSPVGALAVGLVDDEDVGDLHDAGLERLHLVAGAGHQRDDRDVGGADDVHFVLADADRLDDDDVLAGGVEDERGVAGGARQAAEVAARRHAADEHAGVGGVRLHAHAIAEHGAAAERAGRIDGDRRRRVGRRGRSSAIEPIDQRALAGAGRRR